ncbi:MAG: SDR family oxidoreductase [Actinomycetota bacterium]|nr:SDR family oxidoreductase [Actinomycetota bacterium]
MSEIAGKNIVISGGARGIGRLMAVRMARLGGRVILYDLDAAALEAVVDEIRAAGREAYGYVCDVSDRREVYRVADKTKAKVGPVDILINNAGIVTGKRLLEIPDERIEAVIGVNVLALYWLTKSFLPEMIERDSGHVVTMASAAGLLGVNRQTDYSASKHAAIGFTEALRAELKRAGHSGLKTTIVEPFYVDTGMMEGVKSRFPRLLPILKQEEVAERVVQAVLRDEQEVRMPFIVNLVPLLRILPVDFFDLIAEFFGVHESMEGFVGRSKAGITETR